MRSLHVNGYDMAYAEHGTGTPLVLSTARSWTSATGRRRWSRLDSTTG